MFQNTTLGVAGLSSGDVEFIWDRERENNWFVVDKIRVVSWDRGEIRFQNRCQRGQGRRFQGSG